MTEVIKPEVIKLTQDTLGKYVKKPPLTDKLLNKPPFRFLHDIVTNIVKDTKFLSGLYSDFEMVSENIKDRESKIAFLQKLIDCVIVVTDKKLSVRPSKIVAGLEPAKTNELLQAIGYALNKKLDSSTAVAQVLGGQQVSKNKSKSKDEKKPKEKTDKAKQSLGSNSTPRTKNTSDTKLKRKPNEEKVPSNIKVKESPRTKADKTNDDNKKVSNSKLNKKDSKEKELKKDKSYKENKKEKKEKIDSPKISPKEPEPEPVSEIIETNAETSIVTPEVTVNNNAPESIKSEISPLPPEKFEYKELQSSPEILPEKEEIREKFVTSSKKQSKKEIPMIVTPQPELMISKEPAKAEPLQRPKTSLRPPSVRPSSARPGAPRLKDRNEIILPPDEIVSMGKVNVIIEDFSVPEEDNEETVVVEAPQELTFHEPISPKTDIPAEKGHLVNQILEQLEESLEAVEHKPRVEIEWDGGGKRNREAANREMEKLRDSIQTLTRAANPLGKLMNFLQEDIDSMRSELKMWIDSNEKLTTEIKIQEKLNEESIEPLKKQLIKLDDDIQKQHEQIAITQANILKNEQKIKMLLTREG